MTGETVVVETLNCEVVLTAHGFHARCTARGCTWTTENLASKAKARAAAVAHDEAS